MSLRRALGFGLLAAMLAIPVMSAMPQGGGQKKGGKKKGGGKRGGSKSPSKKKGGN